MERAPQRTAEREAREGRGPAGVQSSDCTFARAAAGGRNTIAAQCQPGVYKQLYVYWNANGLYYLKIGLGVLGAGVA
jgi:hypothetical protein